MVSSSKQSPIVQVGAVNDTKRFLRNQNTSLFEYKDVLLMLLFCLALYGIFIYYILPTSANHRQAANELSYYWQVTWYSMSSTFTQVSSSLSQHPVLGEWYQYLFIPW